MFGAVVVGVGVAGSVRIRDLLAPLTGSPAEMLRLLGFISRRDLGSQQGVSQISIEDALTREDVHVAFICTENQSHGDYIRSFLEAGKHVSVEYPMSLSLKLAEELWDLAEQKGLHLHEEHIELFSEDFKALKKELDGKIIQEGTLHFTGGALKPGFGFVAFTGIARLTWLVELFGELSVASATVVSDSVSYCKMTAHLLTRDNRPLTWIEERGPGLPRSKKIHFQLESGVVTQFPPAARASVGLFMQDLVHFSAKVLGQVSAEDLHREKKRVLHCLALAEKIQELSQK